MCVEVTHGSARIRLGEDLFIPDIVVLSPDTPRANRAYNEVVPALVVEVESRSTKSVDRVDKLERYETGVGAYWRIERSGKVNIYRLGDEGYGEALVLGPGDTAELDYPYPLTVTVPSH